MVESQVHDSNSRATNAASSDLCSEREYLQNLLMTLIDYVSWFVDECTQESLYGAAQSLQICERWALTIRAHVSARWEEVRLLR